MKEARKAKITEKTEGKLNNRYVKTLHRGDRSPHTEFLKDPKPQILSKKESTTTLTRKNRETKNAFKHTNTIGYEKQRTPSTKHGTKETT
jgi:hypothetical protein